MFFDILVAVELVIVFLLVIYYVGVSIYELQKIFIKIPTLMTKSDPLARLLIDENITSVDTVLDLGSGSGKTIFYIEKYTKAKTCGYEISTMPYIYSLVMKILHGYKTKLFFRNFLNADFKDATIIYTYLSTPMMRKLEPRLNLQIKNGKKIVSCDFPLPNTLPIRKHTYNKHTFYVYSL